MEELTWTTNDEFDGTLFNRFCIAMLMTAKDNHVRYDYVRYNMLLAIQLLDKYAVEFDSNIDKMLDEFNEVHVRGYKKEVIQ